VTIRKTTMRDLDEVCRIYAFAREFMRESGNMNQWQDGHPSRETVQGDIRNGKSYVYLNGNDIAAVFFFDTEPDPTYAKIDGAWLNDEPYGVVHRIARAENAAGAGALCIEWCFEQCGNLRIDTHEDNIPMRKVLDRLGFTYCGIIWLESGDERLAFQKLRGGE